MTRNPGDCRCSYLVVIDRDREPDGELRDLASYLSAMEVAGCEVIVVDGSPAPVFEKNSHTLRWVCSHLAALPRHRRFSGTIDVVRTALDTANCDKVIVAGESVRYDPVAIDSLYELLHLHEVVEPQDYFDPLPWWSGMEAGRMLLHRGVEPRPGQGATFGMRKSSVRSLRGADIAWSSGEDPVRSLTAQGAEVFSAGDLFVRRLPPSLRGWLHDRAGQAGSDVAIPVKTAFFFALLPVAFLLTLFGGMQFAAGYAGTIAVASLMLAFRGRQRASAFFPLRACLFAPLWVAERSISVYWTLFCKLKGSRTDIMRPAIAARGTGVKVASGLR